MKTFSLRRSMISSESYIFLAALTALALLALLYLLSPMSLVEDVSTRGAEIRTRLRKFPARPTYATDTRTVLVIGAADHVRRMRQHTRARAERLWRVLASSFLPFSLRQGDTEIL